PPRRPLRVPPPSRRRSPSAAPPLSLPQAGARPGAPRGTRPRPRSGAQLLRRRRRRRSRAGGGDRHAGDPGTHRSRTPDGGGKGAARAGGARGAELSCRRRLDYTRRRAAIAASGEVIMAVSQELLDILACPKCKQPVTLNAAATGLVCEACRLE